jgi:hypothetical protein
MTRPGHIRLHVYPAADATLKADVEREFASLPGGVPDAALRELLLERLRPWYRLIEVVIQEDLAHLSVDPTRTWYIYRDGRIRTPNRQRDRLYAALASARQSVDESGHVLDDAQAAARIAGYRPSPTRRASEAISQEAGAVPEGDVPDAELDVRPQSTRRTSSSE